MDTQAISFVDDALSALERSLHDRGSDLRNVQLATVSPDGLPQIRTLVLRGFERSPARAEMHSDGRAGKTRDIAHASSVALLAWSAADHLQLRLEGTARLHQGDDVARARWDKLSPGARKAYGLRSTPGRDKADPGDQSHLSPEEQFRQFVVIEVALSAVDVLRLGPDGDQTRAAGRFTPTGVEASWIGP